VRRPASCNRDEEHRSNPLPSHAGKTASTEIRQLAESRRREIKVSTLARFAAISERDDNTFSLVGHFDLSAAHGIVIWVDTIVAGECIKKEMGSSGDLLTVVVCDAASTKAGAIPSSLTGLEAR